MLMVPPRHMWLLEGSILLFLSQATSTFTDDWSVEQEGWGERLSSNTVISHSTNTFKQLTLWCVKKVVMDKQPSPIWENILKTLDADPPANKMAKQRRKLPAGKFVPGRNGWLCHVSLGLGHLGFEHVVVTTAWVPTWYTSTCGLSCLQLRQKPNNRSNWVRNTMCFGSVRRFVPFAETL